MNPKDKKRREIIFLKKTNHVIGEERETLDFSQFAYGNWRAKKASKMH